MSWSAPTRLSTRATVFCGPASASWPPRSFIMTRMSSSTCTPVESMNSSADRSTMSSRTPGRLPPPGHCAAGHRCRRPTHRPARPPCRRLRPRPTPEADPRLPCTTSGAHNGTGCFRTCRVLARRVRCHCGEGSGWRTFPERQDGAWRRADGGAHGLRRGGLSVAVRLHYVPRSSRELGRSDGDGGRTA